MLIGRMSGGRCAMVRRLASGDAGALERSASFYGSVYATTESSCFVPSFPWPPARRKFRIITRDGGRKPLCCVTTSLVRRLSMQSLLALILAFLPVVSPAPPSAGQSMTPVPSASAAVAASPTPVAKPKASPTPSGPYAHMKWREVGPAASGGRVAAVAGSATDPKLYYIGAAGGGVWKSANGGATWSPVFDDQDVQSIGAVTIAPSDDKTVWVGSGETNPRNDVMLGTGVFKSTDAGESWSKMGLRDLRNISRIVVDPTN